MHNNVQNQCVSYNCKAGSEISVLCNEGHQVGNIIKVIIPGSGKRLAICEIFAYGIRIN